MRKMKNETIVRYTTVSESLQKNDITHVKSANVSSFDNQAVIVGRNFQKNLW